MEIFNNISKIKYEGSKSQNPLAFKYYNPDEIVMGKTMKEHCRFAMSYWHTLTYMGNDPFGGQTMYRPWDQRDDEMEIAIERVHASFEFMEKVKLVQRILGFSPICSVILCCTLVQSGL